MADPTGTHPVSDPSVDPEAGIVEPAHDNSNPSADGGEPSAGLIPPATQPRFQIRAAINSIYNTPRATGQTDSLISRDQEKSQSTEPTRPAPAIDQAELERAAQVESLIAKGQHLARQQQLDNARRVFSEAVRLDPNHSEAWTWLGGLLIDTNLERAHLCLQRAVELDPGNGRAKRGLAQIESRLSSAVASSEVEITAVPSNTSQALSLLEPAPVVEETVEEPENQLEEAEGEPEPVRPNNVKIGVEEAIATLRQSGIETDPENIPLRGALIRPAVEKGQLKRPRVRRRRRRKMSGFVQSMIVLGLFVVILILGIGATVVPPLLVPDSASLTAIANPTETPVPLTADEVFASGIRTEIDHYNRYFATTRTLRLQVQRGKIVWEDYRNNIRSLQKDLRNEKKSLDDLARNATGKLTPYYRQLQSVASIANQAIDFTASGVENTVPEDLEEGNRQFINATSQLVDLSRTLNQASPVPTIAPSATPRFTAAPSSSDNPTPGPTNNLQPVTTPSPELTITPPVVSPPPSPVTSPVDSTPPGAGDTPIATLAPPVTTAADTTGVPATPAPQTSPTP